MNQQEKNSAVKVIRAILSVKVNGTPSGNQIVEAVFQNWNKIKGNNFDDFVDIVNAVKGI